MTRPITVLLVDDHPTLRIGLRTLLHLQGDILVVGETGKGEDVLSLAQRTRPDIIILDCELPGMSGPDVLAALKQRNIPARVLALSAYGDESHVKAMLQGGAQGYILKSEAPERIVDALRTLMQGKTYISPSLLHKAARWLSSPAQADFPGKLTARERQVARMVARGLSNKEIARALGISERTVAFHIGNILHKLNMSGRTEIVAWAIREGLVED